MFMRTERLFLRPGWAEDAAELTRAIGREEVVRMLASVPWPYSLRDARRWLTQPRREDLPDLLVVSPEIGGRIIGGIGLHERDGSIETGYWIAPEHWGCGYATEALRGLVSIARILGHRRIGARHASDNPASGRVLRKAGFRPTGRVGSIESLGRGATVTAPEYGLDLVGGRDAGEDSPGDGGGVKPASPMPRFGPPRAPRQSVLEAA